MLNDRKFKRIIPYEQESRAVNVLVTLVSAQKLTPTPIPPEFWGRSRRTRSPLLWSAAQAQIKLINREIIFEVFQMCNHRQTDRKTDGRTTYTMA